jgi:hypothetical protein
MGPSALLPIREEGVLRIFIALKTPSPRPGSDQQPLGPVASTLATTPPRRHVVPIQTNSVSPEAEGPSQCLQEPASGPILTQMYSLHNPKSVYLRSILIPSTHLLLGLPNNLFRSDFPAKRVYTFLSSPMCATCPLNSFSLT